MVISGFLGAPDAAASAFTIRSIASSTRLRTPSSKVRTFSSMMASSGITVFLGAGLEYTDCHNGGFVRAYFTRHDRLKPQHG